MANSGDIKLPDEIQIQSSISSLNVIRKEIEALEKSLRILLDIRKELQSDPEFKRRLRMDPYKVLAEKGVDERYLDDFKNQMVGVSEGPGMTCHGATCVKTIVIVARTDSDDVRD